MPEIPGGYRHLTYDDRCEIQRMLGSSESVSSIASSLGRSVSSMTRVASARRPDVRDRLAMLGDEGFGRGDHGIKGL